MIAWWEARRRCRCCCVLLRLGGRRRRIRRLRRPSWSGWLVVFVFCGDGAVDLNSPKYRLILFPPLFSITRFPPQHFRHTILPAIFSVSQILRNSTQFYAILVSVSPHCLWACMCITNSTQFYAWSVFYRR